MLRSFALQGIEDAVDAQEVKLLHKMPFFSEIICLIASKRSYSIGAFNLLFLTLAKFLRTKALLRNLDVELDLLEESVQHVNVNSFFLACAVEQDSFDLVECFQLLQSDLRLAVVDNHAANTFFDLKLTFEGLQDLFDGKSLILRSDPVLLFELGDSSLHEVKLVQGRDFGFEIFLD